MVQYICFGQIFKIILVQQAPNTVMYMFTLPAWNRTKYPHQKGQTTLTNSW